MSSPGFARAIRLSVVIVLSVVMLAGSPADATRGGKKSDGDLWVSDFDSVHRYDQRTGLPEDGAVEPNSGGLINAQGVAVGPDGNLYVASFETRQILRFSGSTGDFLDVFVAAGSGGLGNPNDVTFGADGNLYVADGFSGTGGILRFDGTTGAFLDVFASGDGLRNPQRLIFGSSGDLFVGNATSSDVLRFDGETGEAKPSDGNTGAVFVPGQLGPYNTNVAIGPDGDLFVGSGDTGDITRYDSNTGAPKGVFVPGGRTGDMAFGPDGNLYVGNYLESSVLRYDGKTGALIDTFVTSGSDGLYRPTGLTFSPTKAGCKNGGWINFGFKNQGQCIKSVMRSGDRHGSKAHKKWSRRHHRR